MSGGWVLTPSSHMGPRGGWVCPGEYSSSPPPSLVDMAPGIQRDTVGKRAVRIPLEWFLVKHISILSIIIVMNTTIDLHHFLQF